MNADDMKAVMQWMVGRDTGSSSLCMAAHLCGLKGRDDGCYPNDPDDLGRCLRLLALVPALQPELPRMSEVNATWAALINAWDELSYSMENECGIAGQKSNRAPKTYALMRSIIRPTEDKSGEVLLRFGVDK